MLLQEMSWMEVERHLAGDDRIVLITGACEQHGYVSLLSDILVPLAIAREACKREGVLIAPPLPFGVSPYFESYPGTISLRPETFAGVLRDATDGLMRQGFKRIFVSNGHGGNTGILVPLLVEIGNAHPTVRLSLFQWWLHPSVVAVAEKAGLAARHANWSENFPVTRVGTIPEGTKKDVKVPRAASARATRAALGDGSFGGPYTAPDAVMERMMGAAVDAMVEALRALRTAS